MLNEVHGLALDLALDWLDPQVAKNYRGEVEHSEERTSDALEMLKTAKVQGIVPCVRVVTQKTIGEDRSGRLDLELQFTAADVDQTVRVEIKHRASPDHEQLLRYVALDSQIPVVLIAPAYKLRELTAEDFPGGVPRRSWESTGKQIEQYMNERYPSSETRCETRCGWLLSEMTNFLGEEGLMPLEAIKSEDADRISNLPSSTRALEELVRIALDVVGTVWGDEPEGKISRKGFGTLKRYPKERAADNPSRWSEGMWFEFKVAEDRDITPPQPVTGEVVFIAGLSRLLSSTSPAEAESQRLRDLSACDDPFSYFEEGRCARWMRVYTPGSLVKNEGETLEQQGQALGDWVVKAFEDLSKA